MGCLRLLLVITLWFFETCTSFGKGAPETLYYLNSPETLTTSASTKIILPESRPFRIFFHFVNKSGLDHNLSITSTRQLNNIRCGVCTNYHPGEAGTLAVVQYWRCTPSTNKLNLVVLVSNKNSISGILSGESGVGPPTIVNVRFGNLSKRTIPLKTVSRPVKYLIIKSDTGNAIFRYGEKNGITFGDSLQIILKNTASMPTEAVLSFSPRGGPVRIPFKVDGKVKLTEFVHAYKQVKLFSMNLPPKTEIFIETIVAGGWNYPVEIKIIRK